MKQLVKKVEEILSILSKETHLLLKYSDLFKLLDSGIITPIGNILPTLLEHKSKLKDQIIDISLIKRLVKVLNINDSIIRLNHIGFCYRVTSQEAEKERLSKLVKKTGFHLYQEVSNDDGLWLFIGNTKKWHDPMIELLPVEKTQDRWLDYWLPHIQIDIDTKLKPEEIEKAVKATLKDKVKPFPISIDGTIYIMRVRLGAIHGVNIELDIATNSRRVKFTRQQLLKLII